ncbi:hypothetical protein AMTR_s00136p00061030 [Amborella trichopoda]|uniref:Uncharacterized protein n=1 Tax=Amborella trichopoda TaxID=13333 RepID=W1NFK6_AMBTC|nr:hypothetical protein AMTR_s00136p00061030 [Amborella trichopoda]
MEFTLASKVRVVSGPIHYFISSQAPPISAKSPRVLPESSHLNLSRTVLTYRSRPACGVTSMRDHSQPETEHFGCIFETDRLYLDSGFCISYHKRLSFVGYVVRKVFILVHRVGARYTKTDSEILTGSLNRIS